MFRERASELLSLLMLSMYNKVKTLEIDDRDKCDLCGFPVMGVVKLNSALSKQDDDNSLEINAIAELDLSHREKVNLLACNLDGIKQTADKEG